MKTGMLVLLFFSLLAIPGVGWAFECPVLFKQAQAEIDKVTAAMNGMPKSNMALVHSLLDDAKMYLTTARHNHAKPQGKFDHARAMAKADTARGHAKAALVLLRKM